jgi:raffinose/stachyose/melibiose transport system permease protein
VVVIVIFQNVFAIMIALLVESCKKTKGLFRTLFFMPNILSLYISSLMWSFIFSKVFPQIAERTIFKFLYQSWLGNADVAFFSILIVSLWHGIGYLMVIYIAALQGIPSELVEAATIDGATKFQNFRYIVFPLLMPAVTVCLFLTLNGSFKIFDSVYSLTNGGPGYSTEVIALNIYKEGFTGNQRFGFATAKSIILFFIIMVITMVQVSMTKRREVEL